MLFLGIRKVTPQEALQPCECGEESAHYVVVYDTGIEGMQKQLSYRGERCMKEEVQAEIQIWQRATAFVRAFCLANIGEGYNERP